jgi:hypothetical protein
MAKTLTTVKFSARVFRAGGADKGASWNFLNLPTDASEQLPTRSMVSVEGAFNGHDFWTTLIPDGEGGHWLKVDETLSQAAKVKAGDKVEVVITPMEKEPEPEVPSEVLNALEDAGQKATETWESITPMARRDWVFWIASAKKEETRLKRLQVAMSKLSAGNRRPCCFDRTGMYDKSLSSPVPDTEE